VPTQLQRIAQQLNRNSLPIVRWAVVSVSCVLLVACADSDSERRFANDPTLTQEAVPTATDQPIDVAPETPTSILASPVSITDVLASPGGSQVIYYQSGDRIVALAPPWSQPTTVWTAENARIVSFSATANGDLVAILVLSDKSQGQLSLEIVDRSGNVVQEVSNVGTIDTDDAEADDNIGRLSWSPDGNQVVVAPPSGGLIAVPRTGDPVELVDPSRLTDPGTVVWSPKGDAIAFVAPVSPGTAGALYVATTAALPLDPIAVVPASINGRRTIDRVSWRPDGEALYYTVSSTTNDPTFGGDLFEVSSGGGAPTLIATASRVGPVSAITDFAISPDGNGVAYVVTVPRDDGGFTDSLWLHPIGESEFLALPVPRDERVNGLWWSSEGLIWESRPVDETATGDITIVQAAPGGDPVIVYRGPATGSGAATPEPIADGTPIAESSPEAQTQPLPSPSPALATSVASPVASPDASPSAQ
jgi:hypothetical protein